MQRKRKVTEGGSADQQDDAVLNDQNLELTQRIQNLTQEVQLLKDTNNNLRSENRRRQREQQETNSQINPLRAENTRLRSENEEQNQGIVRLNGENNENKVQITSLGAENAQLQQQNQGLIIRHTEEQERNRQQIQRLEQENIYLRANEEKAIAKLKGCNESKDRVIRDNLQIRLTNSTLAEENERLKSQLLENTANLLQLKSVKETLEEQNKKLSKDLQESKGELRIITEALLEVEQELRMQKKLNSETKILFDNLKKSIERFFEEEGKTEDKRIVFPVYDYEESKILTEEKIQHFKTIGTLLQSFVGELMDLTKDFQTSAINIIKEIEGAFPGAQLHLDLQIPIHQSFFETGLMGEDEYKYQTEMKRNFLSNLNQYHHFVVICIGANRFFKDCLSDTRGNLVQLSGVFNQSLSAKLSQSNFSLDCRSYHDEGGCNDALETLRVQLQNFSKFVSSLTLSLTTKMDSLTRRSQKTSLFSNLFVATTEKPLLSHIFLWRKLSNEEERGVFGKFEKMKSEANDAVKDVLDKARAGLGDIQTIPIRAPADKNLLIKAVDRFQLRDVAYCELTDGSKWIPFNRALDKLVDTLDKIIFPDEMKDKEWIITNVTIDAVDGMIEVLQPNYMEDETKNELIRKFDSQSSTTSTESSKSMPFEESEFVIHPPRSIYRIQRNEGEYLYMMPRFVSFYVTKTNKCKDEVNHPDMPDSLVRTFADGIKGMGTQHLIVVHIPWNTFFRFETGHSNYYCFNQDGQTFKAVSEFRKNYLTSDRTLIQNLSSKIKKTLRTDDAD